MIVLDLEADDLLEDAKTIHCMVIWDSSDNQVRRFFRKGVIPLSPDGDLIDGFRYIQREIDRGGEVVGHHICGYDFPVIKRLYPAYRIKDPGGHPFLAGRMLDRSTSSYTYKIIDTFMLSCLLFPQNYEHGLEYWGKVLGVEKPKQEQWLVFDEPMLHRCTMDVEINKRLYLEKLLPKIKKHEEEINGVCWKPAIALEEVVSEIHAQQQIDGVRYNIQRAVDLYKILDAKASQIKEMILKEVPKRIVDPYKGTPVNKPYKKDGTFSKMVMDHFRYASESEIRKLNIRGPFTRIDYEEMNLDSDTQVKNYLLSLGWQPLEWNTSDKTGERTSPKLTEESYKSLPQGVGQTIAEYNIVTHRRGLIANVNKKGVKSGGLWKVRDDGRVPARAFTCGTPTSRYRHQEVVCNIPRPSTPYGEDIRALFCVPSKWWMLGLDLKGIEIRMAAHYCFNYPGGRDMAAEILSGDFHQINADIWGVDRNTSKTGLYLLMYGGMAAALARALGKPVSHGKRLFNDFWERRKPLKMLNDDLLIAYKSRGCLVGLDGRRISIREDRKLLNTLIQGGSAVIFKHWMYRNATHIRTLSSLGRGMWINFVHQVIAMHDELQYEVQVEDKGFVEDTIANRFKANAQAVGEFFNIKVPIEADARVGKNWAETH